MFNHMYGSPFPTINPKVRYRTALERAGFDVNFGPQFPGNYESTMECVERRNASTGSLRPVPEFQSQSMNQNRVNSLPGVRETSSSPKKSMSAYRYPRGPQRSTDGSGGMPSAAIRSQGAPQSSDELRSQAVSKSHAFTGSSDREQHSKARTPSNLSFSFGEQSRNSERELNPIEKSFMMLTQNDTSSNISVAEDQVAIAPTVSSQDSSPECERGESAIATKRSDSLIKPSERYSSDVESLNFEPSSELQISLSQSKPNGQSSLPEEVTPVPALKVTTHFEEDSLIPEERLTTALRSVSLETDDEMEPLNLGQKVPYRDSGSSDDMTTPLTATNLQVEKLIAQLNGVSCSKNAQLDTSLHAATANSLSASSQSDIQSLSVGNSRTLSSTSPRFKKSSAYLSQFPDSGININRQSLVFDDDTTSLKKGDTPTFYKFTEPNFVDFSVSQRESKPIIEPLQLSHKGFLDHSQTSDVAKDHACQQTIGLSNEDREPENAADTGNPIPHAKQSRYAPGEGPCRTCGLEVTTKRVYSKGENELSGQWHRDCFRCLKCDVRFNKKIPCYILEDKPYCQQHYHEENGSICQVCRGFIEGECLENDRAERFHVHCLTCFKCQTPISTDYFIYNGELPLCNQHDLEALLKEGLTEDGNNYEQNNTVSKRRTRIITFGQA